MPAKRTLQSIGRADYPAGDDKCIYCQQDLAGAAIALAKKYREFCDSELQRAVAEAGRVLRTAAADVAAGELELLADTSGTPVATSGGVVGSICATGAYAADATDESGRVVAHGPVRQCREARETIGKRRPPDFACRRERRDEQQKAHGRERHH